MSKKIVLVGEAYGREEEMFARPFIGRCGVLLMDALGECGLQREDVHLTNVCMFRPADAKGRNRPPTEEEIQRELPRLYADIRNFDTVVLLGATAHRTLSPWGRNTLSGCLGKRLKSGIYTRENGIDAHQDHTFVSIWHPAYILRNRHLMPEFISLLRGALR